MIEIFPKEVKEKYQLEDADFVLVTAIQELTKAIDKLYLALDKFKK